MIAIMTAVALLFAQQAAPQDVDWDKEFGVEERVRDPNTGEFPVAPYPASNANADASPFTGDKMALAFGGQAGICRIAIRLVDLNEADPRISDIFIAHDKVRLRRTLFEQFCHVLGAGCEYSGRDMAAAYKDLGLRKSDMNALVENLQRAMREEGVSFQAQNRFLAKLAPQSSDIVTR